MPSGCGITKFRTVPPELLTHLVWNCKRVVVQLRRNSEKPFTKRLSLCVLPFRVRVLTPYFTPNFKVCQYFSKKCSLLAKHTNVLRDISKIPLMPYTCLKYFVNLQKNPLRFAKDFVNFRDIERLFPQFRPRREGPTCGQLVLHF